MFWEETLAAVVGAAVSGFISWRTGKTHHEDTLRRREAEHAEALKAKQKELDAFQARIEWIRNVDHTVLVDGAQAAGKSAFVAKWLDPTLDITRVRLLKTSTIADVRGLLCSERRAENGKRFELRHRVRFVDVPGEKVEQLRDIAASQQVQFVLFVIDPTNLEESQSRLTATHLRLLYADRQTLGSCKGIAAYISKNDCARPEQLAKADAWVKSRMLASLAEFYPQPTVQAGSAKTGAGIFELQSTIAKALDLGDHFPKHQSREEARR